jgi:hypothetical protein
LKCISDLAPRDAKLAAKELTANPLGGELFERNSHRE